MGRALIFLVSVDVGLSRCVDKTLALASGWSLTIGNARLMSGGNPYSPAGNRTGTRSRLHFQPWFPNPTPQQITPLLPSSASHSCARLWERIHPCLGTWHTQLSTPPGPIAPKRPLPRSGLGRPKLPQRFSAALAPSLPSDHSAKQRCPAHYRPTAACRAQLA